MPFMKGKGALVRTLQHLEKGDILLRDNIKIFTLNYNPGKNHQHHYGLSKFVFWHIPQLRYKNPRVQFVTFKMMTPTPWIKAYYDTGEHMLIDCDSRSRQEIHDHVKRVLGKSEESLLQKAAEESIQKNPANFGYNFDRQCICEVPGQRPCPGWEPLPFHLRGKWSYKLRAGEVTMEELSNYPLLKYPSKRNKSEETE